MMLIDRGERGENNLFIHAKHFCKRADAKRQDLGAIARSLGYQIAQHVDHSDALMFGLTQQDAEKVQTGTKAHYYSLDSVPVD